jgi:hypothetical protein
VETGAIAWRVGVQDGFMSTGVERMGLPQVLFGARDARQKGAGDEGADPPDPPAPPCTHTPGGPAARLSPANGPCFVRSSTRWKTASWNRRWSAGVSWDGRAARRSSSRARRGGAGVRASAAAPAGGPQSGETIHRMHNSVCAHTHSRFQTIPRVHTRTRTRTRIRRHSPPIGRPHSSSHSRRRSTQRISDHVTILSLIGTSDRECRRACCRAPRPGVSTRGPRVICGRAGHVERGED